jgi:integrase
MMAIHESRGEAKEIAKAAGTSTWAFSTGRIHSFKTRTTYQQHVVRFVRWARSTHHIKNVAQLDPQAEALATEWLQLQLVECKSPYTLQAERAALRLFFANRALASGVAIPRRARESIRRSRRPAAHDRHINLAHWQPLIRFLQATGLRRNELRALRAREISRDAPDYPGQLVVKVANGKGGKARTVPTLPGREADVLAAIAGRNDSEALVFARIPKHLDVHSYRREYAQALYLHYAPGRGLPPTTGRLKRSEYDRDAAQQVSWALGHNRVDVVLRHYLR